MGKRRKKRAVWVTGLMWAGAGALVGWGVWQGVGLWRALLAQRPEAAATEVGDAASGAVEVTQNSAGGGGENVAATGPVRDEWVEAMTAAGGDEAGGSVEELLTRGKGFLDDGRLVEGRGALNAALSAMGEDSRAAGVREELARLNGPVFLGTAILVDDAAVRLVAIEPGDSFLKLGQQYAVPAAFLEMINPSINPRNLKPEVGVKVVQGPFHVRLVKGARRMDLLARDMYVKSYAAEVLPGDYLPRGTYRVSSGEKIQVGKRVWIGIEGVGAETEDVSEGWLYGEAGPRMGKAGQRVSGVKLADADLAELYNVLVETRSLLRVVP